MSPPNPTSLPTDCDAVVIGLGATGLTCLLHLAEHGLHVVGIDRAGIAAGAAGGNGGFLLAGIAAFYHEAVERYGRAVVGTMYRQTLDELDAIFDDAVIGARRVGSLRIAADDAELADCARHADALRVDGFPVEEYDGPQGSGLLIPTDGAFDPVRRASVLADRVQAAGGVLVTGRPVTAVTGDSAVLADGSVHARHVIVAVDGGLEWLVPELAGEVRTVRLQMLATKRLEHVVCERPVYRRGGLDYYQQVLDGRLFVGGGRDVGGPGEWLERGEDAMPTSVVQDYLDALTAEIVGDSVPTEARWAAPVAMTTSGLPIARQSGSGAWLLGGYNGTGNVVGPLLATALAQFLLTGGSAALDVWTSAQHGPDDGRRGIVG